MTGWKMKQLLPYLGALGIVVMAVLVRAAIDPIIENRQHFGLFLVAVLIAGRYCGFGPSVLTVFLGALSSRYFFLPPRGTLALPISIELGSLFFFIVIGVACALILRSERTARQKLEQEIIGRKRIEADLRSSHDHFHSFLDNGPFAAFMKDEKGRYVYVNKLCERNWNRSSSEWLGKTDHEIYSHDLADEYVENDRSALRDGSAKHFNEVASTPDGSVQHWSTVKFPIYDEHGKQLLGGVSVDVTEITKAEQKARESEAQLLLALDAGSMGLWSWDLSTNRIQSTATQAVIHGQSTDQTEMVAGDGNDNIHPDDRQHVRDAMERATRNEAPERTTYRVLWPDGSTHWVEAVGKVFCDASGTPKQVMGVCTDITDRKLSEDALRESEERFRLLAVHAPVGIALCDAEGRTRFVNPKSCEMVGATPEEVMGYGWQDFIHSDDREPLLKAWQDDIAAGKSHSSSEFRFARRDGTICWASSIVSLIHDASGKPVGQIGITVDLTERRKVEEQLRLRESQLSGILDHTPAVIYLKDPEGRHLLTNRRYQILFQIGGDSVIGKKDHEIFPDEIASQFFESDARVWREQIPLDFEEVAPHPDGLHTYRSVKFPVRDETGKMIALGGISTDISDLKRAHEALKAKEELLLDLIDVQERERQFLCQEFHDGLIQYAVGSLMALEGYQSSRQVTEASNIFNRVITDLRKGIDDGRRVIRGVRPAVLDDSDLEAAIEDLCDQFSTSGIMVTSKCAPEIGRLPDSIQTTIYRVVQEALNNARKHSDTDVVRIELKKSNDKLHLDVQDFGCGFNVESARKKGFGLRGMTERVRLLGGECSIVSEQDVGTRISIQLPIPANVAA